MSSPQNIPVQADVDFEIKKFNINKYELDDGTILRVWEVPVKIFRTPPIAPKNECEYLFISNTIVSASVKKELLGQPSNDRFDPNVDKRRTIEFRALSEPWNIFVLADGVILKSRLLVNQTYVYEKRNNFGEPIYWIIKNVLMNKTLPEIE